MIIAINFIALILAIVFHEVAHGYVALHFGDPTAKNQGRLTLNPIPHIDPIGSLLLPGLLIAAGSSFLIGWAKPVPVRMEYFKHPLKDMTWVALAGPLTNLSLATICSIIIKLLKITPMIFSPGTYLVLDYFTFFLTSFIYINCLLAIFNLLPIPPLDGSKILVYFLPPRAQETFFRLEPFGFVIIFALAYFGFFASVLPYLLNPLLQLFL